MSRVSSVAKHKADTAVLVCSKHSDNIENKVSWLRSV